MMRMHYDPEADAFAVSFAPKGAYRDSSEVAPGVILDFDKNGYRPGGAGRAPTDGGSHG